MEKYSLGTLELHCQPHFEIGDNPNEDRHAPKLTKAKANPDDIFWGSELEGAVLLIQLNLEYSLWFLRCLPLGPQLG